MSLQSHYSVLGCSITDTQLQIKNKYQELVLKFHPDKQMVQTNEFTLIQGAYNVLRDCDSRKEYDSKLLQGQFDSQPLLFATLTVPELTLSTDGDKLSYPCRCGGFYSLATSDVGTECLVNCEECSLVILVKQNEPAGFS